ncbi:PP2C family protein-serine/threonine phosphatase [Streptomyces sp. NPDC091272]|uniref:PP2C family protein-serine/threonine phosphatase n=1 Tax=Streptomyces sp. NPDC091272 TaxID=3365981 RepID=UPI00382F1A9E
MPSSAPPLEDSLAGHSWIARTIPRLPWAVWALAVLVELLTGDNIRIGAVMMAVPPLVAVAHGWRAVLTSGVLAALTQMFFLHLVPPTSEHQWTSMTTAATGVTLASALAAAARGRGERRLEEMHTIVGGVQRALLHPLPPEIGGYRIAGFYQAAQAEARVGGDFYEALETPYGLRMVLGDVCGKGLVAVDATVTLLGAFREAAYEAELTDVARAMDRALRRRQDATADHRFATALIVEAGPDGVLRMVNCGHVPPLRVDRDGAHEIALPSGALIGLFRFMSARPPVMTTHTLAPGTSLLVVTDGVTEARDEHREFFDLAGAVRDPELGACPRALKDAVLSDLARHTRGRFSDDAAALAVTRPADADEAGADE